MYTHTHPSIPYLISSKIMSYINEKTIGERDVEKGGGKGVRYIYIHQPTTTIINRWRRNGKIE